MWKYLVAALLAAGHASAGDVAVVKDPGIPVIIWYRGDTGGPIHMPGGVYESYGPIAASGGAPGAGVPSVSTGSAAVTGAGGKLPAILPASTNRAELLRMRSALLEEAQRRGLR
jgi:hypothetical protein